MLLSEEMKEERPLESSCSCQWVCVRVCERGVGMRGDLAASLWSSAAARQVRSTPLEGVCVWERRCAAERRPGGVTVVQRGRTPGPLARMRWEWGWG